MHKKMIVSLLSIGVGIFISACGTNEKPKETVEEEEVTPEVVAEMPVESNEQEAYELIWLWQDEFSNEEKDKLKSWITEVFEGSQVTMGKYPFDVYVTFHRSNSNSSPVPFGYASRKNGRNEVHFYVDPKYDSDALLADWTAPHEISHLAIPFVGNTSKWFSEGFATFFSRQIMMDMGYYTQAGFDSLYTGKIIESGKYYNSSTSTFVEVSDSLMANYIYGSMYWGSSGFMLLIDQQLRNEKGIRFADVLKEYQTCCRLEDRGLKQIIASFDEIIGEPWCGDLMKVYRNDPGSAVMEQF